MTTFRDFYVTENLLKISIFYISTQTQVEICKSHNPYLKKYIDIIVQLWHKNKNSPFQ